MNKAFHITLKDLRITFGDRNLLLIMFAAPLVLVAIIGVTFGNAAGGTPLEHVPVAVYNADAGTAILEADAANSLNYGQMLSDLLVTGTFGSQFGMVEGGFNIGGTETADFTCPNTANPSFGGDTAYLDTLIDGTVFASADEARAAVTSGDFSVAVIIPAEFSANLRVSPLDTEVDPSTIEVYTNPQAPIAGQIVRSVVDQVSTQFATGNVTLAALIDSLPENPLQIAAIVSNPAFSEGVACAFADAGANITVDRQNTSDDGSTEVNFIVVIGASQAIFFALFVANGQAMSIISERRDWTLQRMLVTPTPAFIVLLGKIMAVFVVILVQLTVLFIGLTVLASIIGGEPTFIWGSNIPGTVAVLFATAFATAGIGSITAAVAKNEEQAGTIGSVVALFMAVFGGAFAFELPSVLSNLSIIHWGKMAFTKLASGNNDILLNIVVLLVSGAVSLGVGFVLFRSKIVDR